MNISTVSKRETRIFDPINILSLMVFFDQKGLKSPVVETRKKTHITTCLDVGKILLNKRITWTNRLPFPDIGSPFTFTFEANTAKGKLLQGSSFLHKVHIHLSEYDEMLLRRFDDFCEFSLSYLKNRY